MVQGWFRIAVSLSREMKKIICICEGYATGATIHEATGLKVLCAMNAGNLPKIARLAVKQFPESKILITADNDHTKDVNTGLIAGKKISEELGLPCVAHRYCG